MKKLNLFFGSRKDYGAIFIRIVIGWRLIAGSWTYALRYSPIEEVSAYFASLHLPYPSLCGWLSVYAQFICGMLFILGYWTRLAAIVMIINFSVAIIAAHTSEPIKQAFAAWICLASSLFLLFHGAGKLSIDDKMRESTN
jgi:putative oxidoreductase